MLPVLKNAFEQHGVTGGSGAVSQLNGSSSNPLLSV